MDKRIVATVKTGRNNGKFLSAVATVAIFLLPMTGGCSKKTNKNPVTNTQVAMGERDLQMKNFTSDCSMTPIDAVFTELLSLFKTSIKSQNITYRFEGANVTRTTRLFVSKDCSADAAIIFKEKGDVSLHKEQVTRDGGKGIDFDYHTVLVSTATPDGAVAAGAVELCGDADWSPGAERDETAHAGDLKCLGLKYPRHEANVYRYDNGVLYFGASTRALSDPAQRPTSLSASVKYTAK